MYLETPALLAVIIALCMSVAVMMIAVYEMNYFQRKYLETVRALKKERAKQL